MKFIINPFTQDLDAVGTGGSTPTTGIATINSISASGSGNFLITPTDPIVISAITNGVNISCKNASQTQIGVSRAATSSEAAAGLLDNVFISPATLLNSGLQIFPWQKTNTNLQMQPNNMYAIVDPSGIVQMALPTNAVPGNFVLITNITGGGMQITQSANQLIFYEGSTTTTGSTGYFQSTELGASICLIAFENTSAWYVVFQQGNFTGN